MPARPPSGRYPLGRLPLPLKGRRVDLIVPTAREIPAFVRLLSEPSVSRWTLHMPYPYRRRDAVEWVRRSRNSRRAGRSLGLTIVRRSDGEVLGGVGLHHLEKGSFSGEVGYWLGRPYRGQGYASEAVELLVRTAFRDLGLHRVEARVFTANARSRRLAERCGFRYEGRLRDEVWKEGRWRSVLLFARLARDRVPGRPVRGPRRAQPVRRRR